MGESKQPKRDPMKRFKTRPYLIAVFTKTPTKGQNTSIKDWGKDGLWDVQETVFFEDRIKNKWLSEAHVILDLLNAKTVKNRFALDNHSDKEVFDYFVQKYSEKVQLAVSNWLVKSGIKPTDKQIKKIEDNISKPGIIAETLEENIDITDKIEKS